MHRPLLVPAIVAGLAATPFSGAPAQAPRAARTAGGEVAAPSSLRAVHRAGSVTLDGRLDEAAWAAAPAYSDFTQSWPQPGKPAADSMSVRVLFDESAIYVGARMYDAHPDSIAAQLARRDASQIYSDWVHVIIDSYHDRRTAFRFTVNPKGVQKDVYTSNDGNEDVNWDAVWECATRVDSLGWVAEYRIPLSQLRYGSAEPGAPREWGFQVMRDVARRNERDSFSPWTPQMGGFVSLFGTLTGLDALPTARHLELVPYVSSKATRAPGSRQNPFFHATDVAPNVGGDVRYGLPGGLTLTATINPDFGQVEVDPAVVNLTAFETFFPEKRPFFLEGSDVFQFGNIRSQNSYAGATFLYSRRIGRPPSLSGNGPGVAFADAPDQTRILGAAKVSGKHGPWTVGLLDAVTAREVADIASPSGALGTSPVEPRADYFAGRVRRDFRGGQTVVGAMLTGVDRDLSDDVFAPLLARRGGFGGVDFEHSWQRRKYYLSGYFAQSLVQGSASVITGLQRNSIHYYQRPDADYVDVNPSRTSLGGHISALALQKTGEWFGSLTMQDGSPGFDINDVGFHSRVDYRAVSALYGYSTNRATKHFRSRSIFAYQNSAWNWGGASIYQSVNGSASGTLSNFWNVNARAGVQPDRYNDKLLRGGPLALQPRGWNVSASVTNDTRKAVWFNPFLSYNGDASGAHNASYGLYVDSRPTTTLHLTFGPTLGATYGTSQYVRGVSDATATSTYGTRYVFADLHQQTLSLDTRVEWTLTRTLSLQTYVQPFVSAGRYDAFKEFATPRTYDFAVYGRDRGTIDRAPNGTYTVDPDGAAGPAKSFVFPDPTFNVRSLRGNAVARWEYRPGSALFVVWQQQRSGFDAVGDFDAGRDVGAIFRTRPTNVFLVKATYWFSP
ncbi:hypothetical protein J421_6223 (plasmid) [Gemmatirosa kalamazoonensis]|uniref:Membrane associated hydrolase n=1 Tax=Gemmatirosa kalamazoonensis TaxID=861299 RepID=W0RW21_9BACT|nr:DUF5916 domain-containing protein [Gemmatirosa kalamazoonensis]AHG93758.1 hypothetical protein J421_6223 [Gemmatirosa kalamazoonensis]